MIVAVQGVGVIDYMAQWDAVAADDSNRGFLGYHVYIDNMTYPIAAVNNINYDVSSIGSGIHEIGVSACYQMDLFYGAF